MRLAAGMRVRVTRDTYYCAPIPAGLTGHVVSVSSIPHATSNGGGFDVEVILENDPHADQRRQQRRAFLDDLGIDLAGEYATRTLDHAKIRSTHLEVQA